VADPANATEWETVFCAPALNEPVQVMAPPSPVELAARTAKRAAAAGRNRICCRKNSPPGITSSSLTGCGCAVWLYAGVAFYVLGLVVYFCAVRFAGHPNPQGRRRRWRKSAAATPTRSATEGALQRACKERQDLKYAALDCWQTVAEALPPGIRIKRFSFTEGKHLSLSGACAPDQISLITDPNAFYDGVRKARLNGQPMCSARCRTPAISSYPALRAKKWSGVSVWTLLRTETEAEAK
jgi:hypothetical protein